MSRELILMRHAKSDWSEEDQSDHERTLNDRGRRAAPQIGNWIASQKLIPDAVLCSTAVRAQETMKLVVRQLESEITIQSTRDLYHASPETILGVVASESPDVKRVMVVGHNPGMEILAGHFSGTRSQFPTAAIIVLSFELDDWSSIKPASSAVVLASTKPKDIGF